MDKYTIKVQVNARSRRLLSLAHQARLGTQLPKSAKSHQLLVLQVKTIISPLNDARSRRLLSLAHQARLGTQLPKSAKSHLLLVLQAKYTIGPLINVLHHNVPKGKFITHNQSLANWFVNLVKNTIQPQIHAKTLRLHNVQPIHHGILV